jgi:hypothetical protein
MADGMYKKAVEAFLGGTLDWDTHDIKAALVDTGDYSVNLTTHQFLSAVGWTAIEASCDNFTGKAITNGVADANNITFSAVTGDQCEAIVIFRDTGNINTSPLICYIDSATGLPVTPNGGDINVTWDDGANKIFNLDAACP